MFAAIGGLVLFAGLVALSWKLVLSHPIFTIVFVVLALGIGYFNIGSTEITKIIGANEETVSRVYGRPNDCVNGGYRVICRYDDMDATFTNGRVSEVSYRRLNNMEFATNRTFYAKVLGMLDLPYREPDVATMDEIVWRIPGVGVITATSDDDMNVRGITIHG